MTDAGWAERKVDRYMEKQGRIFSDQAIKLLLAEHSRAVRIVKRHIKNMDGATPYQWEKGYQQALADVLTALQRGRGGEG